jgi:hypothetical protein
MKTAVEQRKSAVFFTKTTPREYLDKWNAGAAIAVEGQFRDSR